MPQLKANKTVTRKTPSLTVTNPFKPGKYRFRLQVKDDAGNLSAPAEISVTVVKKRLTRIDRRLSDVVATDRLTRVDARRVDGRRINTDFLRRGPGRRRGG